jgi:DNA-directed RNA polymerase specialized sigma24 family protein
MQKVLSLNELFKQYSQGTLERKQFEGLLFKFILENHQRFHLYDWEQDDYSDYLCWLYPRMKRAIDSYRETGASFETYIRAIIHWSAKEYHSRLTENLIVEHTAWAIKTTEMAAYDTEPEYLNSTVKIAPVTNPRQILFLLLKSYYFVSDDFLSRIAPAIGVQEEQLVDMITQLRKLREKRDEEIRILQERSYSKFYHCLVYERHLKNIPENSVYYIRIKSRLERTRQRLETIRRRLAKIHRQATNRQIANILGVPKGTVDSTLFLLKNRNKNKRPLGMREEN